jgi:hypothetical protein
MATRRNTKRKEEEPLKTTFDGMATPRIDIFPDHVTIEYTHVARPRRISPSQWLEFWEQMME